MRATSVRIENLQMERVDILRGMEWNWAGTCIFFERLKWADALVRSALHGTHGFSNFSIRIFIALMAADLVPKLYDLLRSEVCSPCGRNAACLSARATAAHLLS